MKKILLKVWLVLACINLSYASSAAPDGLGRAFLDQVSVGANSDASILSGWAAPQDGSPKDGKLLISVDGKQIYAGEMQWGARPDVVAATGRRDWLHSGWTAAVPLPPKRFNARDLVVEVQFGADRPIRCAINRDIDFGALNKTAAGHEVNFIELAVAAGAALLILSYLFASLGSRTLTRWTGLAVHPAALPSIASLITFGLFVSLGISGSSFGLIEQSHKVDGLHSEVLMGKYLPVRSDEWLVLTPMAIGQVRHNPPFPIVNRNLGPDGQNMLIPGMTSVPVWNLSALGRPATWGFFFLKLPQALAWDWWFPIFGCLLSVWACFATLFPGQWRMALCLSLCFVVSPYVVAWSYWPAYVMMFAASAFTAVVHALKTPNRPFQIVLAAFIGITVSGFVLTLYPAWQIPIAYLFSFLLVAVLVRDWREIRLSAFNILTVIAGLALAAVIVGVWWVNAKDAIAAMVATVYPGQRSAIPGGDIEPWFLARGFTNFKTLYSDLKGVSNASEVASFLYLTLPAMIGIACNRTARSTQKPVTIALILFFVLATWYQYIGFPIWLSELTLWGRTLPRRVDLATGICSIGLIGAALVANPGATHSDVRSTKMRHIAALGATIVWVAIIWSSLQAAPTVVMDILGRTGQICLLAIVAVCSYLLAAGLEATFFVVFLSVLAVSVYCFNPLAIFRTTPAPATSDVGSCSANGKHTLVIGSQFPAMSLLASGCPVLNGIFYYPQMSLWHRLDPQGLQISTYNRYQHLLFQLASMHGSPHPILTTPHPDVVIVTIDSRGFDFGRLPIDYVLARSDALQDLTANPSLQQAGSPVNGWQKFNVVH